MTCMRPAFSLALGLLVVTTALLGAEQEAEDTQRTLEAAVLAGRTSEVQPYFLSESVAGRGTVGAVYTQFVRVARYVWNARQDGHELDLASLPESMGRPEVYVVLPLPTSSAGSAAPVMMAIDRPPSAWPAGRSAPFVSPRYRLAALGTITPAVFAKMVGVIPIERAGLVGIFPPEVAERKVVEFAVADAANEVTHWVAGYVAGPLR